MSYKIAAASVDGSRTDVTFGAARKFYIFEVEGKNYQLADVRETNPGGDAGAAEDGCGSAGSCGAADAGGSGAGPGCGNGGGCGGGGALHPNVELIRDCRCVICKKIGFQVQKQLERLAITGFDIECPVEEALGKIIFYLNRVDSHQSLRGLQKRDRGTFTLSH